MERAFSLSITVRSNGRRTSRFIDQTGRQKRKIPLQTSRAEHDGQGDLSNRFVLESRWASGIVRRLFRDPQVHIASASCLQIVGLPEICRPGVAQSRMSEETAEHRGMGSVFIQCSSLEQRPDAHKPFSVVLRSALLQKHISISLLCLLPLLDDPRATSVCVQSSL